MLVVPLDWAFIRIDRYGRRFHGLQPVRNASVDRCWPGLSLAGSSGLDPVITILNARDLEG